MLRLADVSAETAAKAQATPRRPGYDVQVGISGTRLTGGRVWAYEHNSNLTGSAWAVECEKMLREDPQIAACARALLDTLASATWRFDPAPPTGDGDLDAQAKRAADWCNEAFGLAGHVGQLRGGFEGLVRSMLPFLLVGFRYGEEIYKVAGGYVWLDRLADCEPSAHYKWVTDDDGVLAFVEQQQQGGARKPAPIPANKLVLFTLDRTGQNYEGRGLLRACHFYYRLKTHTGDMLSIGLERWAVPTPAVYIDRAALALSGLDDGQIDTVREAAVANAREYVSHELGYLSAPVGVKFETYGDGAFDPAAGRDVVELCDRQIAQSFLLGFLQLGVSDTGSRSVGEVQESFFGRAAVNFLDQIASVIGGPAGPGTGTVGRLMAWNFPSLPASAFPRLKHDGLGEKPLLDLAGSLPGLTSAGLLTPTDDLESDLRAALGAAPLPDAERRTSAERSPVTPGGAFAQAFRDARAKKG